MLPCFHPFLEMLLKPWYEQLTITFTKTILLYFCTYSPLLIPFYHFRCSIITWTMCCHYGILFLILVDLRKLSQDNLLPFALFFIVIWKYINSVILFYILNKMDCIILFYLMHLTSIMVWVTWGFILFLNKCAQNWLKLWELGSENVPFRG